MDLNPPSPRCWSLLVAGGPEWRGPHPWTEGSSPRSSLHTCSRAPALCTEHRTCQGYGSNPYSCVWSSRSIACRCANDAMSASQSKSFMICISASRVARVSWCILDSVGGDPVNFRRKRRRTALLSYGALPRPAATTSCVQLQPHVWTPCPLTSH